MPKVLVINHGGSTVCGIHDLGLRMYDRLTYETTLDVSYAACDSAAAYTAAAVGADAVIVNYRADLMPWWHHPTGPVLLGVLHNYEPHTVGRAANDLVAAGFDWALALDPDLTPNHHRVAVVGRPLPPSAAATPPLAPTPTIGSFGFAFPHKGFVDVAREVNLSVGEGTFDLHMPEAWFNGAEGRPLYGPAIVDACRAEITAPTVFRHTSTHLTPATLVGRLARNHVNCLLYAPGQPDAGLSSALDYLIVARRPVLVSDAAMFRHAYPYVAVWPRVRLHEVLGAYPAWQRQANALFARHDGLFSATVTELLDRIG